MYCYRAYGLGIHSEFKLFEFPDLVTEENVLIRKAMLGHIAVEDTSIHPYLRISTCESVLSIDEVGRFLIRDGKEIIVDPTPGGDEFLLQRYLVGAAMAILLYQRGRLVLHASAVSINNGGVIFLGGSGAGKSSVAAAHVFRGHPFLVDDVASIEIENHGAYVYPGFPQLKLGEEIANLIEFNDRNQFHFMEDLENKKNYQLNYGLLADKVELKHIYVLLKNERIHIDRFTSQRSVIELVRYSVPPTIVKMNKEAHFIKCLELVSRVPVSGLWRPNSVSELPGLVQWIEENNTLDL